MEQIKRFFENMDEIVYIADMDNYEIIYMNKRQRELWGISDGKLCGAEVL